MMEYFNEIVSWYMANMNYFTIFLLMMIESTFVPLPSEVVIPPAVYKAMSGDMSISLIVLSGTLGALAGAMVNYFLAKSLGRLLVYRFADSRVGHFFLVNKEKVEHAEQYFIKNGKSSTFIGRLIPGVRHLISIPAGLAKMSLISFTVYTVLGAFLWNICLAILGYLSFTQKDKLEKYYHELSIGLLVLGVLFVAYLIYNGMKKKK